MRKMVRVLIAMCIILGIGSSVFGQQSQPVRDPVFKPNALTSTQLSVFTQETYRGMDFYLYVPGDFKDIGPTYAGLGFILMNDDQLAQVAYEFAKASTQARELAIVVAVKKPAAGYNQELLLDLIGHLRGRFNIVETKLWSVGEGAGADAIISLNRACPSAFASMAVNKDVFGFEGPWLTTKPVLAGSNYNVVEVPRWSVTKLMDRTINWTKKHPDYISVKVSSNPEKALLATDKNYAGPTAWVATNTGPSWISIDFQEPIFVTRWGALGTAVNDNYLLESSNDGITWEKLDSVNSNKNARVDRFVKRGTLAQHYRLSSTNPMSITEFEVYGDHSTFDDFSYETYRANDGAYLAYRLFQPNPVNYAKGQKVPLVVYLHGAGQRGYFNESQLSITCGEGATNIAYDWWQKKHPSYIIAIQCPLEEEHASSRVAPNEADLVRQVIARFPDIDTDRVYVTGLSLGGFGTYKLGVDFTDLFAAIVPLAGGGSDNGKGVSDPDNYYARASNLKNMPIWAFHSVDDNMVNINFGISMVEAIQAAGNKTIQHTIYPKGTFGLTPHYCWLYAYYNYDMWEWLYNQNRKNWAK